MYAIRSYYDAAPLRVGRYPGRGGRPQRARLPVPARVAGAVRGVPFSPLRKLSLPFADKSEVDLFQSESEIVVKIGNFKRNIPLPNVLRSFAVTSGKMEEGTLLVEFERFGGQKDEL